MERMEEKIIRAEVEAEVRGVGDPLMLDTGAMDDLAASEELARLKAQATAQLPSGEDKEASSDAASNDPAVDDSLAELKARLNQS